MISQEKLDKIMAYLGAHGFDATILHFNFSSETLKRYIRLARNKHPRRAKILLFDIETSPMELYSFSLFKPAFSTVKIIRDWHIISWAAKWLFEPDIYSDIITPKEIINQDDKRVCKSLWKLIDEADIVIAHNGDNFDLKKINTRFLLHKMPPPSSYYSIDTLKVANKHFAFSSNKLDYIAQLTMNKEKIKTDFDLWKRCLQGEQEALNYMLEYNKKDVLLLEEVYLLLRPWIKSHPNIAVINEAKDSCCPYCGSENYTFVGDYFTPVGQYSSIRCNECGGISRFGSNLIGLHTRRKLLRPVAR